MKFKNPPGTLIYTGEKSKSTKITHYRYRNNQVTIDDTYQDASTEYVDWISVEGLADVAAVTKVCERFNVDKLVIEDILNVTQRNKYEVHEEYLFMVIKYSKYENDMLKQDYISILLTKDVIITFTEMENPFTKDLLERVENKSAVLSKKHEDYLLYTIYDMVVDEHTEIITNLRKNISEVESEIMSSDTTSQQDLYRIHRNLVVLKNNILQLHEDVTPTELQENKFFHKENKKYFDDLEDHVKNILDKTTSSIEVVNSLFTLYSTIISNRMNEIMKTLTIFSAIFIPLSFLAGVFGMNFVKFEILNNPNGFLYFWIASLLIVGGMLFYFKRRKWY